MDHKPATFETICQQDNLTRVRLSGSLDSAEIERIQKTFLLQSCGPGKPLLIEMAGVTFLASLGMGMLVQCCRDLARKHAKTVLLSPIPIVEKALHNVGLDTLLIITHDEARALEILSEPE